MSFGFEVVKDDWAVEEVTTSDGMTAQVEVRTILETKLYEVSAVTFPAYEETDAALRAVSAAPPPIPWAAGRSCWPSCPKSTASRVGPLAETEHGAG
jgi:hypothetical protein